MIITQSVKPVNALMNNQMYIQCQDVDDSICFSASQRQEIIVMAPVAELAAELEAEIHDHTDPSLDFSGLLDAIREAEPTLTPLEEAAYDYGWGWWLVGGIVDHLVGWARQGWQDAHDNYEDERRTEIELFEQTINGGRY